MQQEVIRVLRDSDTPLHLHEIRQKAGLSDPTNTRRSLRSLQERGTVERDDEGRLKLTFLGSALAVLMDEPPTPDPLEEQRRDRREFKRALAEVHAEALEDVRLYREEEARWLPARFARERHKRPGVIEERVLAALSRYSPHPQVGLPRAALVRIAEAGDPAVIRRAIRSLLDRAELRESLDGERVRFTYWPDAFLHDVMWDLVDPPLNDVEAKAVLEGYGEYPGSYMEGA